MLNPGLTEEELERLALFALGLALGLVLFSMAAYLVEEWVIASDQADRRRIREILREMLGPSRTPGGGAREASALTPTATE